VYLLDFHAYINEMHGSRSKIPSKKSRQAALRGEFNSGIKGLKIRMVATTVKRQCTSVVMWHWA
jgi:hypothetical protein